MPKNKTREDPSSSSSDDDNNSVVSTRSSTSRGSRIEELERQLEQLQLEKKTREEKKKIRQQEYLPPPHEYDMYSVDNSSFTYQKKQAAIADNNNNNNNNAQTAKPSRYFEKMKQLFPKDLEEVNAAYSKYDMEIVDARPVKFRTRPIKEIRCISGTVRADKCKLNATTVFQTRRGKRVGFCTQHVGILTRTLKNILGEVEVDEMDELYSIIEAVVVEGLERNYNDENV